ncbi:MAG: SHOCT domain-containing protein [Clostridia bacterium]|nr:SHOCT domain-containing protein [Clostridia bacterium]
MHDLPLRLGAMALLGLLLLALLIIGIVLIVRLAGKPHVAASGRLPTTPPAAGPVPPAPGAQDTEAALQILSRRLASGEIDEEEYKRIRDLLRE